MFQFRCDLHGNARRGSRRKQHQRDTLGTTVHKCANKKSRPRVVGDLCGGCRGTSRQLPRRTSGEQSRYPNGFRRPWSAQRCRYTSNTDNYQARLLLVPGRSFPTRIRVRRQFPGDWLILRQVDLLQAGTQVQKKGANGWRISKKWL
ncbi:hypothetical protein ANCCAN_19272, partial [Ancylostoma caninum]